MISPQLSRSCSAARKTTCCRCQRTCCYRKKQFTMKDFNLKACHSLLTLQRTDKWVASFRSSEAAVQTSASTRSRPGYSTTWKSRPRRRHVGAIASHARNHSGCRHGPKLTDSVGRDGLPKDRSMSHMALQHVTFDHCKGTYK